MNKYILSIMLAFVLITLGSVHITHAQCPTGYTSATLTYGPDANGCVWEVSFCLRCSIVGGIPTSVIIGNTKLVSGTIGCQSPIRADIINYFSQNINSYCTIVPCGNPQVPCSTTSSIAISYPICRQWHIYGSYDPMTGWHFNKWLESCTTGYCQISYKACIDHNTGQIVVCPGSGITYTEVDVTCSDVQISVPPDPSSPGPGDLGDHTYGNCFKYETCP